jgi:casein kinase 1
VLIYLLKGRLPWQGLKIKKNDDKYKRIYEKKKSTSPNELSEGLPSKYNNNLFK